MVGQEVDDGMNTGSHKAMTVADGASGAVPADAPPANYESMCRLFDQHPGPAVLLDRAANAFGLNAAGARLAEHLAGDGGVAMMPQLVQLSVKARIAGKGLTRDIPMPGGRTRLEATVLPQADGTLLVLGRDSTLEASIRNALAESRTRFKDLVDLAADFAWETDVDGCFSYISARGALGYPPEALAGHAARELIAERDGAPTMLPFEAAEPVRNVELWLRGHGGEARCLMVSAAPVRTSAGERTGARGIAIDVTVERRQQAELSELKTREKLVQYILDSLRGAVEPADMLAAAAKALARAAGVRGAALRIYDGDRVLIEAQHGEVVEGETLVAVGERLVRAEGVLDGSTDGHRWVGIAGRHSGETVGTISLWRPRSAGEWGGEERRLLEAVEQHFAIAFRQIADQIQLERLSRTDELTALANRRAFFEDLAVGLQRCWRRGEGGALLYIDLDNFKPINDRHGHEAGDRVMRMLGQRLRGGTRGYDLTARLGGDEFAVWLEGASPEIAERRAIQFIDDIVELGLAETAGDSELGASVGIVMAMPAGGPEVAPPTVEALLAAADAAMYAAKGDGKRRACFAANVTGAEVGGPGASASDGADAGETTPAGQGRDGDGPDGKGPEREGQE